MRSKNALFDITEFGRFDKPQYIENTVNGKTEKYYIIHYNQNKRFVIEWYDSKKCKVGLLTSFDIKRSPEENRHWI